MSNVMDGRCVLVTGARNRWSIGWHAAVSLHREGASLAFSVYGEREEGGVRKLLEEAGISAPIFRCNATDDDQVRELFARAGEHFGGKLHGIVHSMAFANRDELAGEYAATSREGFDLALESSAYTLVTLCRAGRPLMNAAGGGSVVTLTYIGAERVVPNYNVMGVAKAALEASVRYLAQDLGKENIRVNAVSAGPIKTLAAAGITGFDAMRKQVAEVSPLKRAVEADEVGDTILFLLCPWSRGMTGETIYVDGGYHIVGMV
ncbi:MAG TPA: enoyl-ACP reductase [Chthonomonadaceae bacterium]|nr:enoyl-ACP reductase [Chthonomonadaceae bacterium]